MNVLSLFDGMSCGQIALDQLGVKVDNYFASEIDKWAIEIAKKNYPNTIELGDVTQVRGEALPKIDLLIGGSPCQGFSIAGKQLNFNDPRSALFFEFVRILEETKPKYFMLENVKMKREYQDIISEYLGVEPVEINSALVSAQNRIRLYWTNIPNITQPDDKGLLLRDVLEDDVPFGEAPEYMKSLKNGVPRTESVRGEDEKSHTLTRVMYKGQIPTFVKRPCEPREFDQDGLLHHCADATDINGHDILKRVYADSGKSPTLNSMGGGNREPKVSIVPEIVKVRKHEVDVEKLQQTLREHRKPMKQIAEDLGVKKTTVEHWFRTDDCFSIPDADIWFQLKEYLGIETDEFDKSVTEFEVREGVYEMANRVYNPDYKAPTVVASNVSKVSCGRLVNRRINPETGKRDDYNTEIQPELRLEPRKDDKSGCLTTIQKDNVVIVQRPRGKNKGAVKSDKSPTLSSSKWQDNHHLALRDIPDEKITAEIRRLLGDSKYKDNFKWKFDTTGRILVTRPDGVTKIQRIGRISFPDNKTEIVTALSQPHTTYRKLTPLECERLQTVPDNYTDGVSKTQRYKMLGNGWTVEVIKHIFKNIVE